MKTSVKPIITGLAITLAATLSQAPGANAGGLARGTADTDILFENKPVAMRVGATYVAPQRDYEQLSGAGLGTVKGTDGYYSDSYVVPSAAFMIGLADSARCAGTYTEPYGAASSYGRQSIEMGKLYSASGTIKTYVESEELGVTCGVSFDAGRGKFWVLGGLFWEKIAAGELVELSAGGAAALNALILGAGLADGSRTRLDLESEYNMGFRLGAAFEIPEIALRIQGIYKSEVEHDLEGALVVPHAFVGSVSLDSMGSVVTPQSFELKAQSGIAPGTLAFASVKWVDWSVVQNIPYTVGGAPQSFEFFWRDGWTISGGIGRQLTDNVSVAVGLSWDKGVSTTEDVYTDTWSLGGAMNLTDAFGGVWRLGGSLSYLTSASINQSAPSATGFGAGEGHKFGYKVGNDWAYSGSLSYNVNF